MRALSFVGSLSLLLVTGCALENTATPVANVAAPAVIGTVIGGQQPISGATVSVYEVGTSGYGAGATLRASTTTDATGRFAFNTIPANTYTCSFSNAPMYIVATGGNPGAGNNANMAMVLGLGACATAQAGSFTVNEVTTAATVWALGQFFSATLGPGVIPNLGGPAPGSGVYNKGLVAAMTQTLPQLVNLASAVANPGGVTGNVTVTTEAAKLYSIANTLAACVNSSGQTSSTETVTACGQLFAATNANNAATRPYDTVQAALMMDLYPYSNVTALYQLAVPSSPFPGLGVTPNDWTLGLSYTTSALGLALDIASTSTIDVDASGRVWFPSTLTGATGVAFFDPSNTSFSGPYGGATLTHPQFVAIDLSATPFLWVTDLSSGNVVGVSTLSPSTTLSYTSDALSGGPIEVAADNIVVYAAIYPGQTAGILNGGEYTIPVARATPTRYGTFSFQSMPTGIAPFTTTSSSAAVMDGDTGVCELQYNSGTSLNTGGTLRGPCGSGGIATIAVSANFAPTIDHLGVASNFNALCTRGNGTTCSSFGLPLNTPEGIAPDGSLHMWIANGGNASLSVMGVSIQNGGNFVTYANTVTSLAYLHGPGHGGTMTSPSGIAVDGSGNIWVSNAGCFAPNRGATCTPSAFTLSEIVGLAGPIVTPLSAAMKTTSLTPKPTN
jgi:hypothetical protein